MKNQTEVLVGKLIVNEVLEKLWTNLIVDFIMKLPLVVEKNTILVVCSKLFKITYFVVTIERILVKELVRLFKCNVWKLHRLLGSMILDRRPQSIVELIKELNKMLGIKIRLSMVFHPLSGRSQLRAHSLLYNHILRSLLRSRQFFTNIPHQLSLDALTPNQYSKIKEPIVDMNNRFNEVFLSFDPFNKEFSPGSWLIDIFSSQFSFHLPTKQSNNNFKIHIHLLDNIALKSSSDSIYTLIVSNASIKNHVATSILHIHIHNKPVIKTLHHAVNITTTEAKLSTTRCSINQATNLNGINKIIIITDSIYAAKRIFITSFSNLCGINFWWTQKILCQKL